MSDMKPFASLSPSLLARKGAARPAMRPQIQPLNHYPVPEFQHAALTQDDLGWNDMGEEVAAVEEAVLPPEPVVADVPEVVRQQEAIAERMAPVIDTKVEPLRKLARETTKRRSAIADGRRAAFTLRVDQERHLKLRLACTVHGRSAQQLVTEALDRLLSDVPELDDLAKRVRRR